MNKVEITIGTLNDIIEYLNDYIFNHIGDKHSDLATHPFQIRLLDHLIELRSNHLKKEL
mgnify:CR=1 FL=1